MRGPQNELAKAIAGKVTLSDNPGATLQKWRVDFEIAQTEVAEELEVSPSVISDYENGRRENPGIGVIKRVVESLLDIDDRRGGSHIRQHARILFSDFDSEAIYDRREYEADIPLEQYYEAIGASKLSCGDCDTVIGHTVINSIKPIQQFSFDEFYNLYRQRTDYTLIFRNVTRGKLPLVALRVAKPTPNAVVLLGTDEDSVWEHAVDIARTDGFSLAVSDSDIDELLNNLQDLPSHFFPA